MTGSQGLLPALLKEAWERGLAADQHAGALEHEEGTTKKTVISEVGVGMCNIEVGLDASTHTQL